MIDAFAPVTGTGYRAVHDPVAFPAQCSCGHLIMGPGVGQFVVRWDDDLLRPFTWCGFCRTRVDLPLVRGRIVAVEAEAVKV